MRLTTPSEDFYKKEVLLIIFHDAPKLYPRKTMEEDVISDGSELFVIEEELEYIKWALGQGFGVMDLNFPRKPPGPKGWKAGDITEADLILATRYYFANYVKHCAAKKLIFLGIGNAISCPIHVLSKLHSSLTPKLLYYCAFTDAFSKAAYIPNKHGADPAFYDWLYNRSHVYISGEHPVWKGTVGHRSKYGQIVRCEERLVPEMMKARFLEFQDEVLGAVREWKGEEGGEGIGNGNANGMGGEMEV